MNQLSSRLSQVDEYGVPPHQIPSELEMLWHYSLGDDGQDCVVHARTLNLLIAVPHLLAHAELLGVIDRIAVQHPGRIIAMIITPDAQTPRAQATIACRVGDGGNQLCGEQITITCGEQGAPLPSIAASLAVAGVPTFLWWVGDPPAAGEMFESFVDSVDRVLVDSRTWQQPLAKLVWLADVVTDHPYIAFTDLQWTALTPWRRQTAQCFDVPDALPYVERLAEVHVTHGAGDAGRVAALLFTGWLASRLGWQIVAADDHVAFFKASSGEVRVELHTQPSDTLLQRIILHGADATFSLTYRPDTGCVKTEMALPGAAGITRIAPLTALALGQTVSEELNMLNRDHVFEAALQVAARLARGKRSS